MSEPFDVVVLGGGTAGLVTASGCARLGRNVALIEKHALGGDCLWTGCVPTKALVASARLVHQMENAHHFGLEPRKSSLAPRQIMDSMREAQRIAGRHDDPEKFRNLGIDVIDGNGRLVSAREVEVAGRRLAAKDIVIATGSRTSVPPVKGLAETGYLDHASFLAQDEFPRSLIVLGGGYIGIEFAQMFRRFGSRVTVVEMLDEIISQEDPDIIREVRSVLSDEGVEIRTGWKVTRAGRDESEKVVQIENKSGETETLRADELFVASGRRGNIEDIGLDVAGVKTERSYVVVDEYLRTNVPRIWACGDIHGALQFTHVAAYEAVKLVRNILFPMNSAVDYSNIPWALYTDPEVAHLGMTEPEAVQKLGAGSVRTYRVAMMDVDRAVVDRSTRGFIKFVADTKGRILGAHAMCTHASTVIEEVVLARKKGVRIGELAQLVSPYPSLADAIQKSAALYYQNLGSSALGKVARTVASWTHR